MNKKCSFTNNILMSIFFALILILLAISFFQLTCKLKVFFNVKNNCGKLQLKFVGITIFAFALSFKNRCICLTKKNGKNIYLPIEFNEQSMQEYSDLESILLRKIYFKSIAVYFNFGLKHNAFASCITTGIVDAVSKILFCIVKTKKSECILATKVYPNFNKNVIKIGFKAKISISLYDVVWCIGETLVTKQVRAMSQN